MPDHQPSVPWSLTTLFRWLTRRGRLGMRGAVVCGLALLALLIGAMGWRAGLSPAADGADSAPEPRPAQLAQRFARRVDIGRPDDFGRIRDCDDPVCPWLRVLPVGQFTMGDEPGDGGDADESPPHIVSISQRVAVMETEVTVASFKAFVADTGFKPEGGCVVWNGAQFVDDPAGTWRQPFVGHALEDRHPVVCVSWGDATAYAAWLTHHTGKPYRLLSEAEWEYAARAGSVGRYHFGNNEAELCAHANVADRSAHRELQYIAGAACDDGQAFLAPVGTYLANPWGLYDMLGNVWEWVQDCKSAYAPEARDARPVEAPDCPYRLLRGGSWGNRPGGARSANRDAGEPTHRDNSTGFRLARVIVGEPAPGASAVRR
jgi:formylglycine-generating enzyme required for sulfatase activity